MPPADLRVIVRIDPHPDNRQYSIAIVGDSFATASTLPLNGDQAPATQSAAWYRSLPAGQYEVTATVVRLTGVAGTVKVTVQIGTVDSER